MIVEPPWPQEALSPGITLWRYTDWSRLLSLLTKRSLWFARADQLGDPHEGSLGRITVETRERIMSEHFAGEGADVGERILQQLRDNSGVLRQFVYANCWYRVDHESELMWNRYGRRSEGFAIRTSFERLKAAVVSESNLFAVPVQYVDYGSQPVPDGNVLLRFAHKRVEFRDEHELRLLTLHAEADDQGRLAEQPAGLRVPVDPEVLIQELRAGPGMDGWAVDVLRDVISALGLWNRVGRSALDEDPAY